MHSSHSHSRRSSSSPSRAVVVGAGPAGMLAAATLSTAVDDVEAVRTRYVRGT
jgi:cation diffusion facilitator CzcD-associated flavoprotein CzcO